MGNREGRRQTRRWKATQSAERGEQSAKSDSNGIAPVEGGNGFHWCRNRSQRIDENVCLVQQTRTPGACKGCEFFSDREEGKG
jgi:hypothetical protein